MIADATDREITEIWLNGLSTFTDDELLQIVQMIVEILKDRVSSK